MPAIEVMHTARGTKFDPTVTHQGFAVSHVANFAMELIKLAMIQPCLPDGEDSAGNRQYRMLTEQEVVERAVKITEVAFSAFEAREWVAQMPALVDLLREEEGQIGFGAKSEAA